MNSTHRIVAAILGAGATSLAAQQPERAVFMVRLGHDTLAVETASLAPHHFDGDLRYRTPLLRVRRTLTFSSTFDLELLDITIGAGVRGDSAQTHTVLTVTNDSADIVADAVAGSAARRTRVGFARGSIPFNNLSGLTLELVLRRARAAGGDTVMVPLFLAPGQSVPVRVTRVGTDSATLTIAATDIRVHTDAVGRMLGGFVPSQGAYFDRLPGDSPLAAWTPVAASYDAPLGAPYVAEPVSIRTPAGIALAGTLTMPTHRAGARVPVAVLITGSGAQDRDEAIPSLGPYRPFREIADTLSRRGIGVLRMDDRGIGGSSSGPLGATSADFADDIRAAIAFLRARSDVDPKRIALVGHSEGGMIAPMIAATDPALRALVLIAAPARSGRAIASEQRRYAIDHDTSIPPSIRDSLFATREREAEAVYAQPGWVHFYVNHDPIAVARRVHVPTLILQGETDRQVTSTHAPLLASALRAGGNRHVYVRAFPRMNHLMLDDPSGDFNGYARLPSYRVRRDFLGALTDWLVLRL
jgi:Dipeptidyl aminopeptidases/acylaminoacyl-peptidases